MNQGAHKTQHKRYRPAPVRGRRPGFIATEDYSYENLMDLAKRRWLNPEEVWTILSCANAVLPSNDDDEQPASSAAPDTNKPNEDAPTNGLVSSEVEKAEQAAAASEEEVQRQRVTNTNAVAATNVAEEDNSRSNNEKQHEEEEMSEQEQRVTTTTLTKLLQTKNLPKSEDKPQHGTLFLYNHRKNQLWDMIARDHEMWTACVKKHEHMNTSPYYLKLPETHANGLMILGHYSVFKSDRDLVRRFYRIIHQKNKVSRIKANDAKVEGEYTLIQYYYANSGPNYIVNSLRLMQHHQILEIAKRRWFDTIELLTLLDPTTNIMNILSENLPQKPQSGTCFMIHQHTDLMSQFMTDGHEWKKRKNPNCATMRVQVTYNKISYNGKPVIQYIVTRLASDPNFYRKAYYLYDPNMPLAKSRYANDGVERRILVHYFREKEKPVVKGAATDQEEVQGQEEEQTSGADADTAISDDFHATSTITNVAGGASGSTEHHIHAANTNNHNHHYHHQHNGSVVVQNAVHNTNVSAGMVEPVDMTLTYATYNDTTNHHQSATTTTMKQNIEQEQQISNYYYHGGGSSSALNNSMAAAGMNIPHAHYLAEVQQQQHLPHPFAVTAQNSEIMAQVANAMANPAAASHHHQNPYVVNFNDHAAAASEDAEVGVGHNQIVVDHMHHCPRIANEDNGSDDDDSSYKQDNKRLKLENEYAI